jgi:peroxiredoxin
MSMARRKASEQWRGRILVLNYWATWCFPCREEMPGFSRLQDNFTNKGVQFVGISIDEAAKIIEFQKETPVSYPLLIGDMKTMTNSAELGNSRQALPFTVVFDRNGQLA